MKVGLFKRFLLKKVRVNLFFFIENFITKCITGGGDNIAESFLEKNFGDNGKFGDIGTFGDMEKKLKKMKMTFGMTSYVEQFLNF
jgi:hypothetical protein